MTENTQSKPATARSAFWGAWCDSVDEVGELPEGNERMVFVWFRAGWLAARKIESEKGAPR